MFGPYALSSSIHPLERIPVVLPMVIKLIGENLLVSKRNENLLKMKENPKEKSDQEEFSWSMEMFSQNIDSVIESQNLVNRAKTLLG